MNKNTKSNYKHRYTTAKYNQNNIKKKNTKTLPSELPQIFTLMLFLTIAAASFAVLMDKPEFLLNDSTPSYSTFQNPSSEIAEGNPVIRQGKITEITESISSTNAILMNLDTGRVICEKNSDTVSYPASLTKIMSAIIAIENIPDPDNTQITVSKEIVERLTAENSSMAGFSGGETVSATDLLYGCLLSSGGEATSALAEYVAGSEEAFVTKMNTKAYELDCKDTNFTNVTGLHNLKHTSTAKDIATIFKYALENDTFRSIITSANYYTAPTDQHPFGITLTSTVYSAFSSAGIDMNNIKGGKTGYTPEARQCLATYYVSGSNRYILVTLGAGNGTNTTYDNVKDADIIYKNYIKE